MKLRRFACALLCVMLLCGGFAGALGEGGLSILALPQKLDTIEREAFAGTEGLEKVIVQDGTKRIESRAFANSGIREIYLPGSVNYIADDAFEGCRNLKIYCKPGTYAQEYLLDNGYNFELV